MAFTRPKAAQIDFDITNITDPLIRLNSGQSSANDKDVGIVVERGSDANVALIWDESTDSFAVINTSEDGSTSGDVTISSYADLTLKKITQSEQQYTTSNMMKFNQIYTGASAGSYFTQNEYQKILTITPAGSSENYQVTGRIIAQSAGSIQTIEFNVALRSNTLPDLDWSITYTDTHNGTAFFKPQLWTKETTTAGFIFAIQKISSGNLYGTVTVDIDVIPRSSSQKSNVTMNTTQDSETTSVDAGFTARDMTKIMEINGDDIDISAHDGSADGLKLGGTLVTATAAELNILDGVTATTAELNILDGVTATTAELNILDGVTATATELNYVSGVTSAIQTQIDNISSSFTLAADSGSNDTFTTGQTLTFAGSTGIDTTVSDNQVAIAIDSTVATLTGSQTLTNKTLTTPKIASGGYIADANGNEQIVFTTTASAVNYFTVTNTATGANQINLLGAAGGDTNIGIGLSTKGTGNVQIGSGISAGANPSRKLQIQPDSASKAAIGIQAYGATSTEKALIDFFANNGTALTSIGQGAATSELFRIDSVSGYILATGSGSHAGGTERMRIDSSGNVGIGTTSPNQKLVVGGSASGTVALQVTNSTAGTAFNDGMQMFINDTAGGLNMREAYPLQIYVNGSERMRIDSSGNVGIGTSPSNKLDVNGDIGLLAQNEVRFYDSDSSNYTSFRGASSVSSNIVWTLPNADGTDGQVLSTNGGGTLSWADAGSGGGGGGSSYPNSTITTIPGADGNYDLSYNAAQTEQETPFESGGTDAFGINLGTVFDMSDPVGSVQDSSGTGLDLGTL
jgi:hypothetical protein